MNIINKKTLYTIELTSKELATIWDILYVAKTNGTNNIKAYTDAVELFNKLEDIRPPGGF